MKVYKAINAVQAALSAEGISKGRTNQQQGYKFRGIDDVYNAVSSLLAKNGLCILPRVLSRECVERVTAKGSALFYVTCEVEFDFVSSEDGSKHVVKTYGEAMDSADKATNKAMSAAYKYALMQSFAIPTEGDNDADATTHPPIGSGADVKKQAFDSIQPEIQEYLRKSVPSICAAAAENPKQAIEIAGMTLDNWPDEDRNELKKALWHLLDSKTRTAIDAIQKR